MSDKRKTTTVVIRDEDGYIPSDKKPVKSKEKKESKDAVNT